MKTSAGRWLVVGDWWLVNCASSPTTNHQPLTTFICYTIPRRRKRVWSEIRRNNTTTCKPFSGRPRGGATAEPRCPEGGRQTKNGDFLGEQVHAVSVLQGGECGRGTAVSDVRR